MHNFIKYTLLLFFVPLFGQNISVDHQQYSTQELVEDILINSGCIENINVTNTVSGNFNDGDKSFGYFENNGGSFPFANGIVMSTGKLAHVPGPNTSLSDDDAPGWGGDADLEQFLNINHTVNATIIEFDFTPNANNIRFRYIFASEEYRENNPTTCQYSDAFAFLIKPAGGAYENIAVIPGTNTPVKVTTVHPEIPGGCGPENEEYFGSFNGNNAPINFNGETKILTAESQVSTGQTYHIKLVIADEQNYRYDSAVFLEGESFNIGADLGADVSGLCEDETYDLTPEGNGNTPDNYHWYKIEDDGSETLLSEGPNDETYHVTESGTYKVILDYGGSCSAEDEINISYVDFDSLIPTTIYSCAANNSGLSTYNLPSYNSVFTQGHQDFEVSDFFLTESDAENNVNPITDPEDFHNTTPDQKIYARIITDRGCSTTIEITLSTNENDYDPVYLVQCDDGSSNLEFLLNQSIGEIQEEIGHPVQGVDFYESIEDANSGNNPLDNTYKISQTKLPHSVFAKIGSNVGCQGTVEVILDVAPRPQIDPNYQPDAFCEDSFMDIQIHSGVLDNESNYLYEWETGETTPTISVSEPGDYEVMVTEQSVINGDTIYCSTSNTIKVVESEKPEVTYELHGHPGDYEVEIIATGSGDYEYTVDHPEWGFSSETNYPVETGKHTIYVRDKNGCGTTVVEFFAIGYMKYFTPNNDGYNDYWRLLGNGYPNDQVKEIQIYDRYGKLLAVLDANGEWDGNFHGKPMPPNDYWFKIKFTDGSVFTNHFSLIR